MVATTQGAFIDNRPKMPRVSCAHYDQRVGAFTEEECTMMEDMEATPTDFFCQTTWQNLSQTNKPAQPGQPDLTQPGPTGQHKQCLNKTECVSTSQAGEGKGDRRDVHFCCCHGDLCNKEFQWAPAAPPPPAPEPPALAPAPSTLTLLLYTLVPLLVLAVIVGAVAYVYQHRKQARFSSLSSLGEDAPASPPTPTLTKRPVELLEIKARGRFGAVWRGQAGKDMVAVKIFPLQDKQSWFAEQEVYSP